MRRGFASLAVLALFGISLTTGQMAAEPFGLRGYYITFMRMPVMGLAEWKQAVDCFVEDHINTLILWTAGGFRSRKFPITWQYNAEHANVRQNFLRELIDYAHTKHIRVLLGFTPFGYDGVNRYPIEHPELKARKADGSAVDEFGIHSLGWNLCPSKPESQRFMREYIDEMVFDFYPNADGLLVESSDYGICNCPDCGPHYYEREFAFVRELSEKLWKQKPDATILVFPHYFTGAKVPGLNITAAKQPFDPRWGVIFAPHSASFDADLIAKAKTSVSWSDTTALHTPPDVAAAARTARQNGVSGFIPSLEAFSYCAARPEVGAPWIAGKRHHPFGFDPLGEGKMPYNALPVRVQRFGFRTFSHEPELKFAEFEGRLQEHFFTSDASPSAAKDLLELQRIWAYDSDWHSATPLLDPELFAEHAARLQWPPQKLADYERNLTKLRGITKRYASATEPSEREMERLASMVVDRWDSKNLSPVRVTTAARPESR
jgi:hypothetical protein